MFIGEESTREYLTRAVPLQDGFKSWSTQLRQAWESTRFEDLQVSRASALYEQAADLAKRFETETGEKFGAENPYFYLGQMNGPVDMASDLWAKWAMADWDANAPWTKWGKYESTHEAFWKRVDEIAAQYPEFKADEASFMKNITAKAENLRTARDSGNLRFGAGLADFVGSTGALMTDPINMASMMFGGGGATAGARSLISRLSSTAAREAMIGAAAETFIQPDVMAFKKEIGVEHGIGDALSNIGQAAIGGALFGAGLQATGEGVGVGIRAARQRWEQVTGQFPELRNAPGAQDAAHVLDDVIAAYDHSPFEETLIGNAAHEQAMATTMQQILQGKTVELRQVFEGLNRMPETKPVKVAIDESGKAAVGDAPIDGEDLAGDILDLSQGYEVPTSDTIAAMFDPGKEPVKPRDVLAIINEMGGIKPEGETRAMDLHKVRPGLVRKAGRSFGEIREHLEEIGMLPEGSADNEVFDLIDDAVRGNDSGIYHPADFDQALEWESWRTARDNADISREFAESLAEEAAAQGRKINQAELESMMRRADPRGGDDPRQVVKDWLNRQDDEIEPDFDPFDTADLSGRQAGFDIDWARALDMAETSDEAAAIARKTALRRTMGGGISPEDLAKIEAEGRERFADMVQNRPAMEYSRQELADEIERIFAKPDDDFEIVDPENFDAEGNQVTVSAREFLERSNDETEDAAIIATCILNKVA